MVPNYSTEEIGLKIKNLRLSSKMTQKQLGDKVNLCSSQISNIERGLCYPRRIDLFAETFNIKIEYLQGVEEKQTMGRVRYAVTNKLISCMKSFKDIIKLARTSGIKYATLIGLFYGRVKTVSEKNLILIAEVVHMDAAELCNITRPMTVRGSVIQNIEVDENLYYGEHITAPSVFARFIAIVQIILSSIYTHNPAYSL